MILKTIYLIGHSTPNRINVPNKEIPLSEEGKLEDKKCITINKEPAYNERICPEGYTTINMDICINLNKSVPYENGLICDYPFSKIIDDTYIIYDRVDAKNE